MKAGYEALWLDGVALAARQGIENDLVNTQHGGVDTHGNLIFHGASAGLEINW